MPERHAGVGGREGTTEGGRAGGREGGSEGGSEGDIDELERAWAGGGGKSAGGFRFRGGPEASGESAPGANSGRTSPTGPSLWAGRPLPAHPTLHRTRYAARARPRATACYACVRLRRGQAGRRAPGRGKGLRAVRRRAGSGRPLLGGRSGGSLAADRTAGSLAADGVSTRGVQML